ncbi:MAG: RNase adapter RapZ [Rhodospirillaceae bacterium]|nr:MAG: RNase adapter RapZ [Rhodospirillaceae bacterium]
MSSLDAKTPKQDRLMVLVTGMSGAGKTTVLKAFEDLGFEALDNIPLSLLGNIVHSDSDGEATPLAVGVDIRTRDFEAKALIECIGRLRKRPGLRIKILFVDCEDEELLRRYTATRHRHPLAVDRPILDGITLERGLVSPLVGLVDLYLDTTGRSPYDAKGFLAHNFDADKNPRSMAVMVTSFSYRHGIPRDADLMFDVRFLRNPHYDPALKPKDGRAPEVQAYIRDDPLFEGFIDNLINLLSPLVPRYEDEGKSYLTLAIGCTGGKHRSVFVAETLSKWLKKSMNNVRLVHRDLQT